MKLFYNKIVFVVALLFSASAFSAPVAPILNLTAVSGTVSSGDTVKFNLSFSDPVSDFSGMFLDIAYDSNYLTPLYGLGDFFGTPDQSCTGVNCGSRSFDLFDDDFFYSDPSISGIAYLDVLPLFPLVGPLTDIGFISFLVGENLSVDDILTVVTASGDYDTLADPFDPNVFPITFDITGQSSVTILAKAPSSGGTVPTPEILPLILIGLASLFSVVSLRKRRI